MRKAIKDHLRDFLAILGLLTVGLLATYVIVQNQRLRIPLLEEKPFELKAELSTAQAVTPGQGQTVRVAGVRVGDISTVDYEDGLAVVTMDIDRKFLPVYQDATILLRPKTGLKDMFLELDPGSNTPNRTPTSSRTAMRSRVANTAPDTNVDEVLAALDADTRAYLRLLLTQGGEGLNGRGKDLGKLLGSLGPINRGLARLNREVAKRKENLARLIHNMNLLFGTVGQDGPGDRAAGHRRLERDARSDREPGRWTCSAPPACSGRRCGRRVSRWRDQRARHGPRSVAHDLRPFARRLKPINESLASSRGRRYQRRQARDPAVRPHRPRAGPRPAARPAKNLVDGDAAPDDGRPEAQQARQHGRLQPATAPRAAGHPRPGRGLPLLARLAGARRQHHLPGRRTRTVSTAASTWWPPAARSSRSRSPARLAPLVTGFGQRLGTTLPG